MSPSRLLFIVALALAVLSLGVTTVAHAFAWFQVRGGKRKQPSASDRRDAGEARTEPWLTLLKPMCGVDAALEHNLQTVAHQTYPHFDVVFGAADATEPALAYVHRFLRQFPHLKTQTSLGETAGCINPKVSLLARMAASYQRALTSGSIQSDARRLHGPADRNHWYVVSDSNVQLQPTYLSEAVAHMDPDVGLVTHLVAGCGGDTLAAAFENLQLNACITPAVAFVRYVTGRTCVIGKSIFIRADVLAKLGGFEAIGHVLAEDYLVGREVENAGFKVVISNQSVRAWHQDWSFGRYFNRHGRWACMRRNISLTGYMLEPLLAPSLFLTCAWVLGETSHNPGWDVDALGLGVAWSMLLSVITTRILTGEWPGVALALLNPIREWVTLAIWTKGWFIRHIEWRGKSYRVVADSVLHPVNQEFGSGDEVPVP